MKAKIFLGLFTALIFLSSCTRNNGDIGELFGRWRVETVKVDGVEEKLYDDDTLLYTWSFQGSLMFISVINPDNSYYNIMGTWSMADGVLHLDFSYKGNDGDKYYDPPENLHMVKDGVSDMKVIRLTSRKMTLERVSEEGVRYVYHLKKAY